MSPLRASHRRALRSLSSIGALILVAALSATRGAAQQGDLVVERTNAYRAALSDHQAAVDAWSAIEQRWNDALEEHERVRRSGDDPRTTAALVRALDLAQELDRAERRVKDRRAALNAARTGLVAALGNRRSALDGQLATARTPADRSRINAQLRDLDNEQAELDAEGQLQSVVVTYYNSIQFDTRDTPQTLGYKAQLLRSKAAQQDSAMARVDREIERIDRELRRSRNAASLVSGVERYGDLQVPVGTPTRRPGAGDVPSRPDSAGVARPESTPQQRIQQLRLLHTQLEDAKQQFLQRAAVFENQARRIG
jgi:hypothetical protein